MSMDGISPELFERCGRVGEEEELPPKSGSGYFRDTFGRFLKHGAARVAIVVVALILAFSLLAPIFIPRRDTLMDPYYAKLPPRLSGLAGRIGFMDGGVSRRLGERGLARVVGIGQGAEDTELSLKRGEYSPIISIGELEGRSTPVKLDSYLEVGFVYKTVSREEYSRMQRWEEDEGLPLLYPLVADNDFCPDIKDANMWYKCDSDGLAVKETGDGYEKIEFSSDMELEDNYLYTGDGKPVYSLPSGAGVPESSSVRVRVLYYNYYRYKNGAAPDYLLGTDSQGYDLALRVAGGIRVSLVIAVAVSLINFIIGAIVGAVEGYYGGALDLVLERVTDVLSGVPFIVVATLFQIYLGNRLGVIPSLLFAFVLTGWLSTANRVRAQFYRFKNSEYVLAARMLGASDARIILRHIFPNTLGTLITASALVIPGVIFTESMLSFLGIVNLGREGVTSLGTLLADASDIWVNYPHLMIAPALVISLLMISFNLIGNGLREAFDPGMKGGV